MSRFGSGRKKKQSNSSIQMTSSKGMVQKQNQSVPMTQDSENMGVEQIEQQYALVQREAACFKQQKRKNEIELATSREIQKLTAEELARVTRAENLGKISGNKRLQRAFRAINEASNAREHQTLDMIDARQQAIHKLKASIEKVRFGLARHSSKIEREKSHKKKLQKAEFSSHTSKGDNPYEIWRKEEVQEEYEQQLQKIKSNVTRQEAELALRLLQEEARNNCRIDKEQRKKQKARKFVEDMGVLAKQQKVHEYLISHTIPETGQSALSELQPVYPSYVSSVKSWKFGTGTARNTDFLINKLSSKHTDLEPIKGLDLNLKHSLEEAKLNESLEILPELEPTWEIDKKETSKGLNPRTSFMTVTERNSLMRAKAKHRKNLTQPQVVCGRKYEGSTFSCTPSVIYFKDFDVGQTYSSYAVLTNISMRKSTFKVRAMPLEIRSLFHVQYKPPGFLSPGVTSSICVQFTPQENKDFELKIPFISDSGYFSIPVVCKRKTALLELVPSSINFQQVMLYDESLRVVHLKNEGCLDVDLKVTMAKGEESTVSLFDTKQLNQECYAFKTEDGFKIGPMAMFIPGYSTVNIPVQYSPTQQGASAAKIIIEGTTSDSSVEEPIHQFLQLTGTGYDAPVTVLQTILDFGCCSFDELYRQHLVISNSGKTAKKVKILQPATIGPYFYFNQDVGFVQPGQKFTFSIDFNPTTEILQKLAKYVVDEEQAALELPMKVLVSDQKFPIDFVVKFSTTSSEISFDPPSLDFGDCPMNENKAMSLTIFNKSRIPQQYGFLSLPEGLTVSEPFLSILPLAQKTLQVKYRPFLPHKSKFYLKCCTLRNRQFRIPCTAQGLEVDVMLSHNKITFPATALGNTSSASTYLKNSSETSISFQFRTPEEEDITISPASGHISSMKTVRIQVQYAPVGTEADEGHGAHVNNACPDDTPPVHADEHEQGHVPELPGNCSKGHFPHIQTRILSCAVFSDVKQTQVLHLEVATCAIGEELIVEESHAVRETNSMYSLNFGKLLVGDKQTVSLPLKNVSCKPIQLYMSPLNPLGPFRVARALRCVQPGAAYNLRIEFNPLQCASFEDTFWVGRPYSHVKISLRGDGLPPEIRVQPDELLEKGLDMGHLSPGQNAVKFFTLKNVSQQSLKFSLRPKHYGESQDGTRPVIVCRPSAGALESDASCEISLIFSPLRRGPAYIDEIEVFAQGQPTLATIPFKGYCWDQGAFLVGLDDPRQGEFSELEDDEVHYKTTFQSPVSLCASSVHLGETQSKDILIGSMKNEKEKSGSPVELTLFDLNASSIKEGWSISTAKVIVSPGDIKPLAISFTAPKLPPDYNLGGLGYPYYSVLKVHGILKGGSPPTKHPEGQKISIEAIILCNPWEKGNESKNV